MIIINIKLYYICIRIIIILHLAGRQSCGNFRNPSYENPQSLNHQNIFDNVIELSNNSAYSHVNTVTNDERDYESINDISGQL